MSLISKGCSHNFYFVDGNFAPIGALTIQTPLELESFHFQGFADITTDDEEEDVTILMVTPEEE